MTDGLNEARALRITELLRDYQSIQAKIAGFQATPPNGDANEIGFVTLKQCKDAARTLLNKPYSPEMLHPPSGGDEAAKKQLQRVILDASARRFKAQRICLRAAAAMKWIQSRHAILKGQKPKNGDVAKLKAIDETMKQELNNVTDQRVYNLFRTKDQAAGFWLNDDPSLAALQGWMKNNS